MIILDDVKGIKETMEISINFMQDEEDWTFEALRHGKRVGYAWCSLQDNNLLIADIKVGASKINLDEIARTFNQQCPSLSAIPLWYL